MYAILNGIFLSVVNMSITASYCIIAVMLIRLLLRKAPKKFSYLLWVIPLFRLVCPVSFSSVLSIFNFSFFDMSSAQNSNTITYIPQDITSSESPDISLGVSPVAGDTVSAAVSQVSQGNSDFLKLLMNLAVIVWTLGLAALLIYSVISYIILRRRVAKAVKLTDNIYECDTIQSPFVMGLIRPRIYIPFRLGEDERRYITVHEKHHIKRLDHIIKTVAFAVLSVHWFNPLVWIAFSLMTQDMEMSCDEYVLSHMDADIKKEYGTSLLSFASNRRFPRAVPLAFGESGVKGRIKNVLRFKKSGIIAAVISAVVITVTAVILIANPAENKLSSDIPETLDTAVSELIFDSCRADYRHSGCRTEGHKIFGIAETDTQVTVYGWMSYTEMNFMNGYLSYYNGGGMSAPFVAKFDIQQGEYLNGTIDFPEDGSRYAESIKEMFPKKYQYLALNFSDYDFIRSQEEAYAKQYLASCGFGCKVALSYKDIDVKLCPAADNLYDRKTGYGELYPDWVGTQMFNENGKWIVYAQFYNQQEQKVYLTSYENGSTQASAHVYAVNGTAAEYIGDETITVYPFFEDKNLEPMYALPDIQESTSAIII